MDLLLIFISHLIDLYWWIVIASVVMSWLLAFGAINAYNPTVRGVWQGLQALTEPLLKPIRRVLPNMGAVDISPIILLLGCSFFVQIVVIGNLRRMLV